MKRIYLFVLTALMMLMSTSAMAQNETIKGDVNGDGVVDVADIAAVIKIMTENGSIEKKYYWYAGQIEPTSMTSNPTPSSEFTCNNWFEIGTTLPTIINQRVTGGTSGNVWYAAVPTDAGLVAGADGIEDTSMKKIKTITVNGVNYDVWNALGVTATRFMVQYYKK